MGRADVWLYDMGAAAYAWATVQPGWQASCAALVQHLPADAARILDLGCGPGQVAAAVAPARPGARVYGLDIAARMLVEARRRLPANLASRLTRADASRLPFEAGVFDAVTAHSFLYLVPDRSAVLAETWRVLRPQGRIVLMEPWAGAVTPRAVLRHSRDPRFLLSVGLWRTFNRFRGRFRAAELAALLGEAGFVRPRGQVVLGGLGLVAWAERPP